MLQLATYHYRRPTRYTGSAKPSLIKSAVPSVPAADLFERVGDENLTIVSHVLLHINDVLGDCPVFLSQIGEEMGEGDNSGEVSYGKSGPARFGNEARREVNRLHNSACARGVVG